MASHVTQNDMVSSRTLAAAALALVLAGAGGGYALAGPPPWAHGHHDRGAAAPGPAQPAQGELSGTIESVDYGGPTITIGTPRGPVLVVVTPTTSIYRGAQFATLSDLTRGTRVTVDFSSSGGQFVAQIIRIR